MNTTTGWLYRKETDTTYLMFNPYTKSILLIPDTFFQIWKSILEDDSASELECVKVIIEYLKSIDLVR